jgi:hypothetical protein
MGLSVLERVNRRKKAEQAREKEQMARALAEESASIAAAEMEQSQERQAPSAEAIRKALRHFVRRLFLSPRLPRVLEERLRTPV